MITKHILIYRQCACIHSNRSMSVLVEFHENKTKNIRQQRNQLFEIFRWWNSSAQHAAKVIIDNSEKKNTHTKTTKNDYVARNTKSIEHSVDYLIKNSHNVKWQKRQTVYLHISYNNFHFITAVQCAVVLCVCVCVFLFLFLSTIILGLFVSVIDSNGLSMWQNGHREI